ncbi:TetR/AcrR family transcriptional regulator (plasmid) [Phyllobacterium sp. 628]|uniref:TetR/AcrR family transcriptional regulator n=1 Tax=Phyllobacterium sp. 628 TaxID=2718938 RepID=UPI00166275C5|nr:TetR/AcrR family transcriptional regulator [Phyllobacterium sp. 628]QND54942.1 TetR/AcrR family transcriptional regulator [Phyllobacterium sp. 628]
MNEQHFLKNESRMVTMKSTEIPRDDHADQGEDAGEIRRSRGRPQSRSDAETQHLILEAATRVFLENGYTATRMETVARDAGVAKRTIYRFWTTKSELLTAIVAERSENIARRVDEFLHTINVETLDRLGLKHALEHILSEFAHLILSDSTVAFYRLITAEALNFPEIAKAFYREGPARTSGTVARFLEQQQKRGLIKLDDTHIAATMLMSMVTAEPFRMATLGIADVPQDREIEQRVAMAAAFFWKAAVFRNAIASIMASCCLSNV